jgi:hypothetical protein
MRSRSLPPLLAVATIVILAALLRLTALDWGLRHVPHADEQAFVENVARMLQAGDFDHRFYEYPGLFLYLLMPVQAAVGGSGPAAYLAARTLTALCGVASVLLVALLGRRLGSPALGLAAALLLAVSPLEVVTAHMVRPDVALEAGALLVLLACQRLSAPQSDAGFLRAHAWAGAALATAISIKFTGVLLLPSYVAACLLAPRRGWRGPLVALAVALLLGALFTPYALLKPAEFLRGATFQMEAHYKGQVPDGSYWGNWGLLVGAVYDALGPLASLLGLAGIGLSLQRWRLWLPALLHPLAVFVVMASADLLYVRHVLPCLAVFCLLAALPISQVAARRPRLAALLALLCALGPLRTSWNYVGNLSGSSPRDRVLDWVQAHLPAGSTILDARPEWGLGFDRSRYDVVAADERRGPLDNVLAENVDVIVTGPGLGRRWGALVELFPGTGQDDAPFQIQTVAPGRRAQYERVPLSGAKLTVSENQAFAEALRDDDWRTVWSAAAPQRPGQWIELEWPQPVPVARVELLTGTARGRHADDLRLWVRRTGEDWRRTLDLSARAPVDRQPTLGRPTSQLLLVPALPITGLRLAIGSQGHAAWEVAELRLDRRR